MVLGVEDLVRVGGACEAGDLAFGDVLKIVVSASALILSKLQQRTRQQEQKAGGEIERKGGSCYLHPQISMQKNLKLKPFLALIPHIHHRLQAILAQRHTVHDAEVVRPRLAEGV